MLTKSTQTEETFFDIKELIADHLFEISKLKEKVNLARQKLFESGLALTYTDSDDE